MQMTIKTRVARALFAVIALSGIAKGAVIGGIDDQLNAAGDFNTLYTLTLPKFNSALGTLNSVTIFFKARVDYSNISIENQTPDPASADVSVYARVVRNFVNSAHALDNYGGTQTIQIFHTSDEIESSALGNCATVNPANRISNPGCGSAIVVAGNDTEAFGPYTSFNTDPVYGLTTGTGFYGLLGVTLTSVNPSAYIGSGTFTLQGRMLSTNGLQSDVEDLEYSQAASRGMAAEVNYDYTPAAAVPEPGTVTLFGSALVGAFFLRKRLKN
jgi:hypothetical protein